MFIGSSSANINVQDTGDIILNVDGIIDSYCGYQEAPKSGFMLKGGKNWEYWRSHKVTIWGKNGKFIVNGKVISTEQLRHHFKNCDISSP